MEQFFGARISGCDAHMLAGIEGAGGFCRPLTVEHEAETLREASLSQVEELSSWGATVTLRAVK